MPFESTKCFFEPRCWIHVGEWRTLDLDEPCDLCDSNYVGYTTRHLFQRIADHRYSAIGRHLRDAHGNIDLLNESQFRMLKKMQHEMGLSRL